MAIIVSEAFFKQSTFRMLSISFKAFKDNRFLRRFSKCLSEEVSAQVSLDEGVISGGTSSARASRETEVVVHAPHSPGLQPKIKAIFREQ